LSGDALSRPSHIGEPQRRGRALAMAMIDSDSRNLVLTEAKVFEGTIRP
jgi:hypothetical protein